MERLYPGDGGGKGRAAEAAARLSRFRGQLYGCLGRRADELFELTDALLCAEGSVRSLVGLCLVPEHRRGPGPSTTRSTTGRSMPTGCVRGWRSCRCRGCSAGGFVLAVDATP